MRRSVAVSVWLAATVGASVLAWSAVDRVAADVTDHPSIEGSGAIRRQLGPAGDEGPTGAGGLPGAVATAADGTPVPGAGGTMAGGGAPTGPDGAAGGGAPGASAIPGAAGGSGGTAGTASPGTGGSGRGGGSATPTTTTPVAAPTTTTTAPATGPTASVVVTGGSVTAACSGGTPVLVRAIPDAGYGVQVGGTESQLVVSLQSTTHLSIVEAECEAGRVQFSTGEESTG